MYPRLANNRFLMPTHFARRSDSAPRGRRGLTWPAALALTVLLVIFLVAARMIDSHSAPDQVIRKLETIDTDAAPAPEPPPPIGPDFTPPPPPPPPATLPRPDIHLENFVPLVVAPLDRRVELTMRQSDFFVESDPVSSPHSQKPPLVSRSKSKATNPSVTISKPVMKQSYSAGELDARPRLINQPTAAYPSGLLEKGIREGRVTLEVAINSSGSVSVRRVISSSHPDFSAMARSFAARARFSVPKKNGKPVTAIYQWPLILKP